MAKRITGKVMNISISGKPLTFSQATASYSVMPIPYWYEDILRRAVAGLPFSVAGYMATLPRHNKDAAWAEYHIKLVAKLIRLGYDAEAQAFLDWLES